jgi:hypothetical protein
MQQACSEIGSAYVDIAWNTKAHRQGKEKQFNTDGAKLLVAAVNQAIVNTEKHGLAAQRGAGVAATATAVAEPAGSQIVPVTGQDSEGFPGCYTHRTRQTCWQPIQEQ